MTTEEAIRIVAAVSKAIGEAGHVKVWSRSITYLSDEFPEVNWVKAAQDAAKIRIAKELADPNSNRRKRMRYPDPYDPYSTK